MLPSSHILSLSSPPTPPQLEIIVPPKCSKPATPHGGGAIAKSMKRTAPVKSPPSSAKQRLSDQYAKKYPTKQRDLLHHDTSNSVTSPMTTMMNSPTQLTTTPASNNDSTVTAHSGEHPFSNKNEIANDTTSNADNRSLSMLQIFFKKTKCLGAIIAGASPPKPTETPNNLQADMSVARGGGHIDNNNDDSDTDANAEIKKTGEDCK